MDIDASICRSPKRKRGQEAPGPRVITTSGLSQSLTHSADHCEEMDGHSPSTRVTGKFQKLDLRSPLDLPSPADSDNPGGEDLQPQEPPTVNESPPQEFKPLDPTEFTFESPIMKSAMLVTNSPAPASSRVKSPPPSSVVSDQFWHASEITGWSPEDPDEDYYGVNGVGYAKPAGKAWAISQKRKQQIAEYRSRETREARQRRHEKRLGGMGSRRGGPMGSPRPESRDGERIKGERSVSGDRKGVRFVHFENG